MASKLVHLFYLCVICVLMLIQIYSHLDMPMDIRKPLRRGLHISEFNTMHSSEETTQGNNRLTTQLLDNNRIHRKDSDSTTSDFLASDSLNLSMNSKNIRIVLYHPVSQLLKRYVKNYDPEMCIYNNCQVNIIYNISKEPIDADAIIFQGNNMRDIRPVRRDSEQVFVFQTIECPLYLLHTDLGQTSFIDYFNWTMTYRRDSDIPFPYGTVMPKAFSVSLYKRMFEMSDKFVLSHWSKEIKTNYSITDLKPGVIVNETYAKCVAGMHYEDTSVNETVEKHVSKVAAGGNYNDRDNDCFEMTVDGHTKKANPRTNNVNKDSYTDIQKDYKAIYRRKSKDSAWMVSHCFTASKRETYVKEMAKYMKVDIYGKCSRRKCPKNKEHFCIDKVVQQYRFYMAFENSICSDYITEKAFLWFDKDIITVVRGGSNYNDYFPPGTFIDAGDFKSAKALSEYLLKLGSDEDAYIEYLRRKDQFRVIHEFEMKQVAYCQLCRMLNNKNRYIKNVHNISEWWQKKGICVRPSSILF